MRAPIRLLRELGPAGFITLQLVVGGTVLAALVHPLFSQQSRWNSRQSSPHPAKTRGAARLG
ncbi:MAG: hypothetical protein ACXW3G_11585, partial [Rhodoplanes sp.]